MRLRDITKMRTSNDGTRSLFQSAMMAELVAALRDWGRAKLSGVLIGGMGLSYHARPRMTQDLDFIFLSDVPKQVVGFKRTRPRAFQHNKTHVEIEIITPNFINVPPPIVEKVFETTTESNGIRVASASGLVALKLCRLTAQDRADVIALIKSGRVEDINQFPLPKEKNHSVQRTG